MIISHRDINQNVNMRQIRRRSLLSIQLSRLSLIIVNTNVATIITEIVWIFPMNIPIDQITVCLITVMIGF